MKKIFCLILSVFVPFFVLGYSISNSSILDENGKIVNFTGINVPYLAFLSNNEIENAIKTIYESKIKVIRIFASSHGSKQYSFENMLGVYNENMFSKVDLILAKASKYGLKVIITLMDNNKTYGGKEVYKDWVGGNHNDILFKDKISREYFKKFILKFITRKNTTSGVIYKNDPTIFAWDICNEADNEVVDNKTFYEWINEVAKFIKANDTNHFVTINLKKILTSEEVINFYDYYLNPDIDLISYNIYLTKSGSMDTVLKDIENNNKLFYLNINKPIILNFADSSENNNNSIDYVAERFFNNYGSIIIYNYGGFGSYANYPGAFNLNNKIIKDSFIAAFSKANNRNFQAISIKNIKIKPDQQSAIAGFSLSNAAEVEIYYGENLPLKNKTKKLNVSGEAEIVITDLKPETKYLFFIKAKSGNLSGISQLSSFTTLKLTRIKAVQFKRSNNFIKAIGTKFYDGNRVYRYLGTSNYYLRNSGKETINYILSEAAKAGFKVIRVGSNAEAESFDTVDKRNLNRFFRIGKDYFNEDAYKELDYVLDTADKYGLRVILHFTDNWEYYGGVKVIAGWAGVSKNDFWTDENSKKYYRQSIDKIVNRKNTVNGRIYKNDPTIFAYDLCNEPRDENDQTSKTLAMWIDEMSTYVKSVDPNHLVTTGLEGFFLKDDGTHYSGADYILCHKPKNIDFCTFHIYPTYSHNHFSLSTTEWLIKKWIKEGHETVGKPVVMEEYGISRNDEEYPKAKWIREMTRIFFENGGDGANYWFFIDENYVYGDGFEVRPSETAYMNEFIRWANILNKDGY